MSTPTTTTTTKAEKPIVALNEMNRKHAVITNLGGKCVVMEWVQSQVDPQWEEPAYQGFTPFRERYANRYVELVTDGGRVQRVGAEPIADWWLVEQKIQSLDGLDQWWLAKLSTGETPCPYNEKNPRWVLSQELYDEAVDYSPRNKFLTQTEFGLFLRQVGCEHKSTGKAWGWVFPP